MTPYPYQEEDIVVTINEPTKSVVNASVVGTGKTLYGTEVIARSGSRVSLILAPVGTFDSWARTVYEQTGQKLLRVTNKCDEEKRNFLALHVGKPGIYFIGWEFARRDEIMPSLASVHTVVGDEVHRACNRKAKTAALWWFVCNASRKNGGYRVAMSATPWGNMPAGAWAVCRGLWPEVIPASFWKWANKYITVEKQEIAGRQVFLTGFETEPGAIARDLPLYIRHERDHQCCAHHPNGVQEDLPRRIFHDILVDLTATQRRIYKDLEKDMFAWIDENNFPIDTEGYPMVNAMRLHQATLAVPTTEMVKRLKTNDFGEKELMDAVTVTYKLDCKSSKIDAVLEVLADLPENEPVLVFTHSTALIPALVHQINKKFGDGYAHPWSGVQSHTERQATKDRFIANNLQCEGQAKALDTRVIVAQISAISEGVDGLQQVCSTEIWVSTLDDRKQNTQAKGRLLRNGQDKPVNCFRIMARDTIEEGQMERLFAGEHAMAETLKARN